MKLMFISDLHGALSATEKALDTFAQSGAQWLIILGDLLNHGPRNALPEDYNPAEVAQCLNQVADKIIAIRGNCDSEVDQMLLDFPITAPWQQVLLPQQRLFLTHGHLYNPEQLPPLAADDVLVFGHTHLPVARQHHPYYLFNPGSISMPKGGYEASFGMLDDDVLSVRTLKGNRMIAQVRITP